MRTCAIAVAVLVSLSLPHNAECRSSAATLIPPASPRDIVRVWEQRPDTLEWSNFASSIKRSQGFWMKTADDFMVETDDHIVALEWWGQIEKPEMIDTVRVYFYERATEPPYDIPGERTYVQDVTGFSAEQIWEDGSYYVHHYTGDLPVPFEPAAGDTYWLCVQAIHQTKQWWWLATQPCDWWGEEAAYRASAVSQVPWTPISEYTSVYDHLEMAFVLHADDWTAVEETTWGVIKAMFR
jgi:hypothetical protein